MNRTVITKERHHSAGLALGLTLALAMSWFVAPASAAPPPVNRTYFTVTLGEEGPYSSRSSCLKFSRTRMCNERGRCGTWWRPAPGEQEFAFEFEVEQDGYVLLIEGLGRGEQRGKGSSFFGVARAGIGQAVINLGIAARSTSGSTCRRLLREWSRDHPEPQVAQNPECAQRAEFGDPATSQYILPYPVGGDFQVGQTYCYLGGGHEDYVAYDFTMPIGTDVIAAREGSVTEVRDDLPDDGSGEDPDDNNEVVIEHDDGTRATYLHVRQGSIAVGVGERVAAGQRIAASGNAGFTGGLPHLHVAVWGPGDRSEAVNFRNANGPLDERGGLINFVYYEALED